MGCGLAHGRMPKTDLFEISTVEDFEQQDTKSASEHREDGCGEPAGRISGVQRSNEELKVKKEEWYFGSGPRLIVASSSVSLRRKGQASVGRDTHKCDRKVCMEPGPWGSVSIVWNTVNFRYADIQGERNSPTRMVTILLII